MFRTAQPVRPQAQLVTSPSCIAIDLPGTQLGRPTVRETVPGVVCETAWHSKVASRAAGVAAALLLELGPI